MVIFDYFQEYQLEQSFTDHTHAGCIKTVAASRKGMLASGGSDETIQLYNLRNRRQLGCLDQHSGSVTCIDFYKHTHMFSCSEDGTFCIWKAFTWECLKTLKGHQGAINHLAIHPSGKLALTVGRDKTLRTWNLITGRSAYITNIKKVAEMVFWSPDGQYYLTIFPNSIDVYKMENTVVAYGGDDGVVFFHDIKENKVLGLLETNTSRIRGLSMTPNILDEINQEIKEDSCVLCTASSDGYIKVYNVEIIKGEVKHRLLASTNTEFRLTSIAVALHKNKKEKTEDSEDVKPDVVLTSTESDEDEKKITTSDSESEEIIIVKGRTDKSGSVAEIDRLGDSQQKKVKKSKKGKHKRSFSDTDSKMLEETPKKLKKDKSKVVSFEDQKSHAGKRKQQERADQEEKENENMTAF
ncbi:hypothetical protein FSP39_008854 [Pinctada imbricata]|uniref:P21-activated protein kinase-interacting protein 1-like n=1 Tax=Pinctada imbricata TaxID=66713 RepID=A0AA89BP24_PINIB|nr:hypothetical protein FSP39_008854 [Pinctada imbricata]